MAKLQHDWPKLFFLPVPKKHGARCFALRLDILPHVHTMYFMIRFECVTATTRSNQKKHGVSFQQAQSVFFDDFAVQFFDEAHSDNEDRFLLLGMSNQGHLLLVCHCEREAGNVIRIISARHATNNESQHYPRGTS